MMDGYVGEDCVLKIFNNSASGRRADGHVTEMSRERTARVTGG